MLNKEIAGISENHRIEKTSQKERGMTETWKYNEFDENDVLIQKWEYREKMVNLRIEEIYICYDLNGNQIKYFTKKS
jgi:hypothetical protein